MTFLLFPKAFADASPLHLVLSVKVSDLVLERETNNLSTSSYIPTRSGMLTSLAGKSIKRFGDLLFSVQEAGVSNALFSW